MHGATLNRHLFVSLLTVCSENGHKIQVTNKGMSNSSDTAVEKEESEEFKKVRTPSGTVIEAKVSDIRSFFISTQNKNSSISTRQQRSLKSVQYKILKTKQNSQRIKVHAPWSQRLRSRSAASAINVSCSSDHRPKQTLHQACKTTLLRRKEKIAERKTVTLKKSVKCNKSGKMHNSETSKASSNHQPMETVSPSSEDQRDVCVKIPYKGGVKTSTVSEVSQVLQAMADESSLDAPATIDVKTVHAMFKSIKEDTELKIAQMQLNQNSTSLTLTQAAYQKQIDNLTRQMETLKMKNRVLGSTVQSMWDNFCECKGRVDKLDMNTYKKYAILTSFYADDSNKRVAIRQIGDFLEQELGFRPGVDDYYNIGESQPKSKVIIFQSLKDKAYVMKYKYLLKGVKNQNGKEYYINDFYPTEENERRKKHKQLFQQNQEMPDDTRANMELYRGKLYVEGEAYKETVRVPDPQDMLDLTVKEMNDIMQINITKGPRVTNEENIFIAYTAEIVDLQHIQDAYLKMRICHPKARHIICAYTLSNPTIHGQHGCCDDGEHGAGIKMLDLLLQKKLTNRVIFATRYYSGVKIGVKRFECIESAVEQCLALLDETKTDKETTQHKDDSTNKSNTPEGQSDPTSNSEPAAIAPENEPTPSSPATSDSQSPTYQRNQWFSSQKRNPPLVQKNHPYQPRGAHIPTRGPKTFNQYYRRGRGNSVRNRAATRRGGYSYRGQYRSTQTASAFNARNKRRRTDSPNDPFNANYSGNNSSNEHSNGKEWDENFPPLSRSTSPDLTRTQQIHQRKVHQGTIKQ